jgi:alpha-1,3-rhamnosyl/mannosyltransferase
VKIHSGFDPQFSWENSSLEDSRQFLNRLGIHGSFILSVATLQPRKNLRRLLEAYAEIEASLRDKYRLLLVGGNEGELDALKEACRTLGIQRHVVLAGFLPSEGLRELYRQASCFVFPSLHEGFGFPLLEAMASGCPACASRVSSLPEVGGDAVLYFDPYNVGEIRRTVQTLLTDEGQSGRLRERGLQRAQLFSWQQATRTTLELFEEVGRNGRTQ